MERRRERRGLGARLARERDELLEEQRVAPAAPAIRRCSRGVEALGGDRLQQLGAGGLDSGRSITSNGSSVVPASARRAPFRLALEQVGARDPGDEHRRVAHARRRRRAAARAGRARPGARRRARGRAAACGPGPRPAARTPSRGRRPGCPPRGRRRPPPGAPATARSRSPPPARRSGARPRLLDDPPQRPVRHALAVGRAARAEHAAARARDRGQLGGEARLADAGVADDRDQLRRARVDHARERRGQALELGLAADQRAVEPAADRRRVGVHAHQQEAALAQRRGARPVAHEAPRRPVEAVSPPPRTARAPPRRPAPRRPAARRPAPRRPRCRRRPPAARSPPAARRRRAARAAGRPRARAGRRTPPAPHRRAARRRCRRGARTRHARRRGGARAARAATPGPTRPPRAGRTRR